MLIPLAAVLRQGGVADVRRVLGARSGPSGRAPPTCSRSAPSLVAAVVNVVLGLLVAWVLVRYEFPGKRLVDALVDLPFALPTAVAGWSTRACTCRTAGSASSWCRSGSTAPTRGSAIVLVLIFIGLPFVVRTVQPVLEDLDAGDRGGGGVARRDPLADVPRA